MKTCKKNELSIFTTNIITLRKNHNLSKKEMAKILGISIYMLNKIETGIIPKNLNCDVLFKIHKHFNIHPSLQFKKI